MEVVLKQKLTENKTVTINEDKVREIIYKLLSSKNHTKGGPHLSKVQLRNGDEIIAVSVSNTYNGNIEHYSPESGEQLQLLWSCGFPIPFKY